MRLRSPAVVGSMLNCFSDRPYENAQCVHMPDLVPTSMRNLLHNLHSMLGLLCNLTQIDAMRQSAPCLEPATVGTTVVHPSLSCARADLATSTAAPPPRWSRPYVLAFGVKDVLPFPRYIAAVHDFSYSSQWSVFSEILRKFSCNEPNFALVIISQTPIEDHTLRFTHVAIGLDVMDEYPGIDGLFRRYISERHRVRIRDFSLGDREDRQMLVKTLRRRFPEEVHQTNIVPIRPRSPRF